MVRYETVKDSTMRFWRVVRCRGANPRNEKGLRKRERNKATDLKSDALRECYGYAPPLKRVKAVQDEDC